MARLPRLYMDGCAHHIIQRGNNRQACFFEEADYKVYLDLLKKASEKYKVSIHAFVLMTNHVHLLTTPNNEIGNSRMMQAIGRSYVGYINHTYSRTGALWEGRYKSTLVDSEDYLLTVHRYIELNPVRAGMVEHASEYSWSSYQGNAMGKEIELITPHDAYTALGKTKEKRLKNYRTLFRGRMAEKTLKEIRDATHKGWVLGSERFIQQIEQTTGRTAKPRPRGGDRKSEQYWKRQYDHTL